MTDRIIALQIAAMTVLADGLDRLRGNDRQRGVVSVEYIVLGAAIIALVGYLAQNGAVKTALQNAFSGLFEKAGSGS